MVRGFKFRERRGKGGRGRIQLSAEKKLESSRVKENRGGQKAGPPTYDYLLQKLTSPTNDEGRRKCYSGKNPSASRNQLTTGRGQRKKSRA